MTTRAPAALVMDLTPHQAAAALTLLPPDTPEDRLIAYWLHDKGARTQVVYAATIADFRAGASRPLAALTLADVQAYADDLAGRNLAPATRARMLATVKSLLTFGHEMGVLRVNAGKPVKLPAIRDRLGERILTEEDTLRMVALEPDPRNRALLKLLYGAGVRISEACSLRWADVQLHDTAGIVTIFGKGEQTRAVRISAGVLRELLPLRGDAGDSDPVFRSRQRTPLSTTQAWRIVRAAAQRVGIDKPVSPHWLRHAHASHALDRGAPVHLVQATLGHRNLATTSRYTHARPGSGSSEYLSI
jgi:integrase/recombinase XerD